MSEIQNIENDIIIGLEDVEGFLAKAATEVETLVADAFSALKNTAVLLAKNPEVAKALKDGIAVAVSTILGAGEAGGAGAAVGAITGAATVLLKDVEAPAGSALCQIVQGEIAAAVEAPLSAVPEKANP